MKRGHISKYVHCILMLRTLMCDVKVPSTAEGHVQVTKPATKNKNKLKREKKEDKDQLSFVCVHEVYY